MTWVAAVLYVLGVNQANDLWLALGPGPVPDDKVDFALRILWCLLWPVVVVGFAGAELVCLWRDRGPRWIDRRP